MSSSSYKGNLTVNGPGLDKSKLQLRRPTPDSDVLASSDDDRDHVRPVARPAAGSYSGGRRQSLGWMHDVQSSRKPSLPSVSFAESQPTTPALEQPQQARRGSSSFAWNTNNFGAGQSGSRLKEVVPSPTSAFAASDKPLASPTLYIDEGLFQLIDQAVPSRKAVRSQSYSIGQGDIESSPVGKFSAHQRPNLRHRPSKPSLLSESTIGLSQLREDDADDIESSNGSEHGVRLPAGYWERERNQALLKQAARNLVTSTGSPVSQQRRKTTAGLRHVSYGTTTEYAIEELDYNEANMASPALTRRFSEHVSILPRDHEAEPVDSSMRQQWATDNIPMLGTDALGRRHSIAHYGGSYNSNLHPSTLGNTQEEDEDVIPSDDGRQGSQSPEEAEVFDAAAYFAGYGPVSRAINASAISAAHPDPIIPITPNTTMSAGNPYAVPHVLGRPGRRLYVVTFKCSRADIYYLFDNIGLEVRCGDLVIVEGDRGCDLGQVTHADVSLEDAKKHKTELNEEHFRWLVMFSQCSLAGTANDSGMVGALAHANGFSNNLNRPQSNGMGAPQDPDAKPRPIKRLAQQHEISALREKEGQEAKAKRFGAQKAAEHGLLMEILDAEFQADYHKLTYYYFADAYVNFNQLVVELFKQNKVRIWMSAVNPASVVNPAGLRQIQPPSAIGPGAILHAGAANASMPVGPGFGNNVVNNSRRSQEHLRRNQHQQAAQNTQNVQDDGSYPFSYQIPNYAPQTAYNMAPWAQGQGQQFPQQIYDRFTGYPMQTGVYANVATRGSPMNQGAWYPPNTFAAASPAYGVPSSGPAFRGGYPASTSYAGSQSYSNTAGSPYTKSQSYATTAGPSYNGSQSYATTAGSSYGGGQSYATTTGPSYTSGQSYGTATAPSFVPYGASAGTGFVNPYTNSSAAQTAGSTATSYGMVGNAGNYANSNNYGTPYDPAFLAALQNMSFAK